MQYKNSKFQTDEDHYNDLLLGCRSPCSVVHTELVTSWPVTALWILMSCLVSTLSTSAYMHPEWFVREHSYHHSDSMLKYDRDGLVSTLGMVSACHGVKDNASILGQELDCHNFVEDFPTTSWQTSYVLFGSGCVLLTWCSILALSNVWIVGRRNRQMVAVLVGRIQLVAVILQFVSLILYPLVLGSPFVRVHCGSEAEIYAPARCRLGWAYIAAITSAVLACYCPLLAHFTHYNVFSSRLWTDI